MLWLYLKKKTQQIILNNFLIILVLRSIFLTKHIDYKQRYFIYIFFIVIVIHRYRSMMGYNDVVTSFVDSHWVIIWNRVWKISYSNIHGKNALTPTMQLYLFNPSAALDIHTIRYDLHNFYCFLSLKFAQLSRDISNSKA